MAAPARKAVLFVWEGTNKKGTKVNGQLSSINEALAKTELRRQGIKITKIKKKSKFGGKGKITTKEISVFSRQMATMMSAGVPLVQSFEIVGRGHENPAMQEMIMSIKAHVEGGGTFAEALSKHPRQFDKLFCSLVNAGEQGGILETLLIKIALYKEKTEAIKGKIKKALMYPTAIIAVCFIVTGILMIFVVPQFQELFSNFGADLPGLTQFVIDLSAWLQKWYWAILLVLGVLFVIVKHLKIHSQKFNDLLDHMIVKLPIIGNIIVKAIIARFARTLSTMFAAGTPLVEAMGTVAGTAGNVIYSTAILKMRDQISTGTTLTEAMRDTMLFPNIVVQMVMIGEEAGSVDAMLAKVADFYEQEVDDAVDGMSSLLEPIIMAFLGIVIGGLVVAMYLPIFKMGAVV